MWAWIRRYRPSTARAAARLAPAAPSAEAGWEARRLRWRGGSATSEHTFRRRSCAFQRITDSDQVHGVVAGRCARLLFDAGVLDHEDAARRLSRTLSIAEDPARAAAWVEGFLAGSGQLLLHDDALWRLIDEWLVSLRDETFVVLLPPMRRAFSSFAGPERRQLGARARRLGSTARLTASDAAEFDDARAEAGLRTVLTLLGVQDA